MILFTGKDQKMRRKKQIGEIEKSCAAKAAQSKFANLAPITNVNLEMYEDILDQSFADKNIHNIALSGSYGSGKSSVIQTYEEKHPELNFIHISLAHFENAESEHSPDEPAENANMTKSPGNSSTQKGSVVEQEKGKIENVLEGKILNQLIHQINPKYIPQTDFKVKQTLGWKNILPLVIFPVLIVLFVCHIVFFPTWQSFTKSLPWNWLTSSSLFEFFRREESVFISGIFVIILSAFCLFHIIRAQKRHAFLKKVSIQGNEIEVFGEESDSYFDRYLNEVLYLFEHSHADAIVFEDIDRHSTIKIFERLREINTLIHQNQKAKQKKRNLTVLPKFRWIKSPRLSALFKQIETIRRKREGVQPIRFFYLMRDDIFITNDRTKFFDLIIPIIPIVDSSNSYDLFIKEFQNNGTYHLFDLQFLHGLSLYIDDMRILKNICNEFIVYYYRLTKPFRQITLDPNKMLAIITYKNLFPEDFAKLQLHQGYVYQVFSSRDTLAAQEIKALNPEIDKASRRYLNNISPQTEKDVQKLKHQIDSLRSVRYVKDIFSIVNQDRFEDIWTTIGAGRQEFTKVKENHYFPLIKYLIIRGYLDETYADYMTYFYPNSITEIDKNFLRNVAERHALPPGDELDTPVLVLDRLTAMDFTEPQILNYSLIYTVLSSTKYSNFLDGLLTQIVKNKKYDFVSEFFSYALAKGSILEYANQFPVESGELFSFSRGLKQWESMDHNASLHFMGTYPFLVPLNFVKALNQKDAGFLKGILQEDSFPADLIMKYILATLYLFSAEDIMRFNQDNCLTEYLSDHPDILTIPHPHIPTLIQHFKDTLHVCFNALGSYSNYSKIKKPFFQSIYENDLYTLDYKTICLMLREFYHLSSGKGQKLKQKNYSLIMGKPEAPLAKYVNQDINHYLSIILENCDEVINDDEPVAISVINNKAVDPEMKRSYIQYLATPIQKLSLIKETTIWPLLLDGHTSYNESNIVTYFFRSGFGLDPALITFINQDEQKLSFTADHINQDNRNENITDFFEKIASCANLSDKKYREILSTATFSFPESFNILGIPRAKMKILIDLKKIPMAPETLTFMRKNYVQSVPLFLQKNIKQYVEEVVDSQNFDYEEMHQVLTMPVSIDFKFKLLKYATQPISIIGKGYPDGVEAYILHHNLSKPDIPYLLEHYSEFGFEAQQEIRSIVSQNISAILEAGYPFAPELFDFTIRSAELTLEQKKELLANNISILKKPRTKNVLQDLGLSNFLALFTLGKQTFDDTPENRKLLEAFQTVGWITQFTEQPHEKLSAYGRKDKETS